MLTCKIPSLAANRQRRAGQSPDTARDLVYPRHDPGTDQGDWSGQQWHAGVPGNPHGNDNKATFHSIQIILKSDYKRIIRSI